MAQLLLQKKEEIYGFQTLYREIGYYITRLAQYERALKFFDEALKKTPNDKRALMGRSRARAKACQYEGALEDINKALQLDSEDLVVLAHKALNTYLSCEFEESLVQNSRLAPIRQKPDHFVLGVMDCTNAIENSIGDRVGRPLRDHFKIIRKLGWKRNYEAQKPFTAKSKRKKKKIVKEKEPVFEGKLKKVKKTGSTKDEECMSINDSLYSHKTERFNIPKYNKPFPYKPLQNYTTNIENYMAEKYLKTMYLDKIFLKQLKYDPCLSSPNKVGAEKLLQLAKNGYKTVNYQQELLRARRPFYFIKYTEATSTGGLKERQEAELNRQRGIAKSQADYLLNNIEKALQQMQLRVLLETSEKLREFCLQTHINILPTRSSYLEQMFKHVCDAFYDTYRLNSVKVEWDQEKRILIMLGREVSREPSNDSVIQQFKGVYMDYKKQVLNYENRVRNCKLATEMALLYHELARFHIELKHFELSRVYAKKCIKEGQHFDNFKWEVNGLMLLAKINILQHNKNDAKNQVNRATQIAKERDDARLGHYMKLCLEVIDKMEFDTTLGFKVLEKREQQIIGLMANRKMRDDVAHLFQIMSSMPSNRRMVVIPGVRIEDLERISANIRHKSIATTNPQGELAMDAQKRNLKKKFKDISDKTDKVKGLSFMDLIQYHLD